MRDWFYAFDWTYEVHVGCAFHRRSLRSTITTLLLLHLNAFLCWIQILQYKFKVLEYLKNLENNDHHPLAERKADAITEGMVEVLD